MTLRGLLLVSHLAHFCLSAFLDLDIYSRRCLARSRTTHAFFGHEGLICEGSETKRSARKSRTPPSEIAGYIRLLGFRVRR